MNYEWKGADGFKKYLKRANDLENDLAKYLEQHHNVTVSTSQGFGSFSDWDLQITYPDGDIETIEVKEDKQNTGNIAVELHRNLQSGIRPTCISVTKATYFAYYFDTRYYIINTSTLKHLLTKKTLYWNTYGGDGGRSWLAIFKKKTITDASVLVIEIPKEQDQN